MRSLAVQHGGSLQRRTLLVLSIATTLCGLGVGASLSVGALLLAEVSGNEALSGLSSAVFSAGAAIAGIPLARLAARRGRRAALVTGSSVAMAGALVAILATVVGWWGLLAVGIAMLGVGSAVQLLARFAATDLALPEKRARDLSLVVWSITIGAVVGPNLMGPGAVVGGVLGVTPLAGVLVFAFVAQGLAVLVHGIGLRPDPLLVARQLALEPRSALARESGAPAALEVSGDSAQMRVIFIVAMAQAIMVGLMAMTPLHLMHHGGTVRIIGFTLSLHIAGMYALSPVFGTLASRFGRLRVIGLGWLLMLIAVVCAYFCGPSPLMVQVAMMLVGLGWGALTVAGAALLTEITPMAEQPRWQGRSDTLMSAAGAMAGALSGVVFAYGDFSLLALLCGGLVVLGILASLQLTRRVRCQPLVEDETGRSDYSGNTDRTIDASSAS
jgi:MFS family permease